MVTTASDEAIMCAEMSVDWREETFPLLGHEHGLPAVRLLEELTGLWPLLREAIDRSGPGRLWPGSLRWDEGGGWQILTLPALDADGTPRTGPVPETPGAREQDAWAVACALVTAALHRQPRDLPDALALLDLHAGVVPLGLDAIVHAIFAGRDPAPVHEAVRATRSGPVSVRSAAETGTGSAKAKGDACWDNEDAFTVVRYPEGTALAVCDGVTGPGDGSGARASRAAVRALERSLAEDGDVGIALGVADRAVLKEGLPAASTALIATIPDGGVVQMASVGDSPAWLVRPLPDEARIAFRLVPDQTALAEELLDDPGADADGSKLRQHLGGCAEAPYLASVHVRPGDLLVLLSDGAAVTSDRWFGDELAELAGTHPRPSALAAALVSRAERLGGRDNATAVIAEIRTAY